MQIHDLVLITKFLRQLEEETHLKWAVFDALLSLSLRFPVLTERVQAASLVDEDLLILLATLDQLVIDSHGLPIIVKDKHCK